ncbi:response regulator [Candidatus Saccharibacteria bacterium]|nr:response regulator [Candidatus Saccharibacteria bacterium]
MSNIKIVLVEDEKSIREMYVHKFKSEGFEISEAENGVEGLKIIENTQPALVLLDLRMPVMDGEEMLKKLRGYEWGNNVPVVILTNVSQSEAPHELRFLKVAKYVVKAHTTPSQVVSEVVSILIKYRVLPSR